MLAGLVNDDHAPFMLASIRSHGECFGGDGTTPPSKSLPGISNVRDI